MRLSYLGAVLIAAGVTIIVGCESSCKTLADESCEKAGEESAVCQSRSAELDDPSIVNGDMCRRALILYRGLPQNHQE